MTEEDEARMTFLGGGGVSSSGFVLILFVFRNSHFVPMSFLNPGSLIFRAVSVLRRTTRGSTFWPRWVHRCLHASYPSSAVLRTTHRPPLLMRRSARRKPSKPTNSPCRRPPARAGACPRRVLVGGDAWLPLACQTFRAASCDSAREHRLAGSLQLPRAGSWPPEGSLPAFGGAADPPRSAAALPFPAADQVAGFSPPIWPPIGCRWRRS